MEKLQQAVTNYHTHTTFCDGADTPEAMVQAAIEKKFTQLGFSAHAMYPYASLWHMGLRDYDDYRKTIRALEKTYQKEIDLFLGFEADYFPLLSKPDKKIYEIFEIDYLIGSVHLICGEKKQGAFSVDGGAEEVARGIKTLFNSSGKKAVQSYFAAQREMMESCDFHIVGHIDVIRKRNGQLHFFDETEPWYRRELAETAKTVAKTGKVVEINTGAIARGIRETLYPSADFLALLRKNNVPILINSDAHRKADLDCAFETAVNAAQKAGYGEVWEMTKKNGSIAWQNRSLS